MKLIVAVLVVMATVGHLDAHVVPKNDSSEQLVKELQNFMDLIPMSRVIELTKVYLARDKEFQFVMDYMLSSHIKHYVSNVEEMFEFSLLVSHLEDRGIPMYSLLEELNESLKVKIVKVAVDNDYRISGGLDGYFKDLSAILPLFQWVNLFEYKVITSHVFKDFVREILSPKYTVLFTSTYSDHHFQSALRELKELEINSELYHANFLTLLIVKGMIHHYL